MTACRTLSTLLSMLSLLSSAIGSGPVARAFAVEDSKQAVAQWLSQQLNHPITASQVLTSPNATALEGCSVTRTRPTHYGRTSLSMRCPAHALPQLVLLDADVSLASSRVAARARVASPEGARIARPTVLPIVRTGSALRADWRTDNMHALLDVIAMDSGDTGAEIRVRISHTNRVMRARILNAHAVSIIPAGA
ncbi:MAG TPA: flagella basal body P-ring formation protein FlgA [Candidatus Saccharimonadales bacterium]|nr:flagella basal body P-ring formation protein FlgA [Candidatus Saccharimonadales bacterium]